MQALDLTSSYLKDSLKKLSAATQHGRFGLDSSKTMTGKSFLTNLRCVKTRGYPSEFSAGVSLVAPVPVRTYGVPEGPGVSTFLRARQPFRAGKVLATADFSTNARIHERVGLERRTSEGNFDEPAKMYCDRKRSL